MRKDLFSKTYSKKMVALLVVIFASTVTTFAQKDSTRNNYYLWTNVGGNASLSTNSTFLVGLQLGLNLSINQKHYFKINSYATSEFDGSLFASKQPNKLVYIRNVSGLYGIIKYHSKSFATIISTGISYGEAQYRGDLLYTVMQTNCFYCEIERVFDLDYYNYWGVPIEFTILWTTPRNGFSIDAFVNFHKHSDYGLRLNYNIGKIRNRPTKNI
ncbi:MAG: hypothetical protein M3R27_08835 [Bacteroidota bacterium]|nr:hypothetical protein [Bacteroidota bacterium]